MAQKYKRRSKSEALSKIARLGSGSSARSQPLKAPDHHGRGLPHCEGPKMYPFKHQRAKIIYEDILSKDNDQSPYGGEGYVFKVRIKSQQYALKLFRFYDLEEGRHQLSRFENERISDAEFVGHLDPFFAECRAYGRMNDKIYRGLPPENERDYVAAPCYGYIYVGPKDEELLRERFNIDDWNRQDNDFNSPIRGLVKKLIDAEEPVDTRRRSVLRMRSDLFRLRKIGIYQLDIDSRNYRAGLLLDFGHSYTEPHCIFRVLPSWQVELEKEGDLEDFDRMIAQLHIKTTVRALRKPNPNVKTRSSQRRWENERY